MPSGFWSLIVILRVSIIATLLPHAVRAEKDVNWYDTVYDKETIHYAVMDTNQTLIWRMPPLEQFLGTKVYIWHIQTDTQEIETGSPRRLAAFFRYFGLMETRIAYGYELDVTQEDGSNSSRPTVVTLTVSSVRPEDDGKFVLEVVSEETGNVTVSLSKTLIVRLGLSNQRVIFNNLAPITYPPENPIEIVKGTYSLKCSVDSVVPNATEFDLYMYVNYKAMQINASLEIEKVLEGSSNTDEHALFR